MNKLTQRAMAITFGNIIFSFPENIGLKKFFLNYLITVTSKVVSYNSHNVSQCFTSLGKQIPMMSSMCIWEDGIWIGADNIVIFIGMPHIQSHPLSSWWYEIFVLKYLSLTRYLRIYKKLQNY